MRTNTVIRMLAGLDKSDRTPIVIKSGNGKPKQVGSGFHYENKGGDIVHHPNAYRRAWGKPIYIPSTLRIEVGEVYIAYLAMAGAFVKCKE